MDKKREVPVIQVDTLASPRHESNVSESSPVSFLRLFRCATSSILKLVVLPHQQAGSITQHNAAGACPYQL
jgi:hypothetical protein